MRFNFQDFPRSTTVSIDIRGDGATVSFVINGQELPDDRIRSIWYRRTAPFGLPEHLDEISERTAKAECGAFIQSVWSALGGKRWVSNPVRTRAAGRKAEQLIRARRFGFRVPSSLFTNSARDAQAFYRRQGGEGRVVYKPHTSIMIRTEDVGRVGVVYTSLLGDADLERIDDIGASPGIFQPYVDKDFEVRVTVIGDRVFPCAIYSQEDVADSPGAKIDWRNWRWDVGPSAISRHGLIDIESPLRDRILELVGSYGLNFAAIDFIVTPDGEWIFLELNPNGQWVWIEEMTGAPMAEAMVDLLTA